MNYFRFFFSVGVLFVCLFSKAEATCRAVVHNKGPTFPVNPLLMGCHSDSGYAHQVQGLYSQMIYGGSFEEGLWPNVVVDDGANVSVLLDNDIYFNGQQSLRIDYHSGSGRVSVSNRGLGNEGLVFEGGKDYEGYVFVKAEKKIDILISLEDYVKKLTLSSQIITYPGGSSTNWTALHFDLTPISSTSCIGIPPLSDPAIECPPNNSYKNPLQPGALCVRCSGQFTTSMMQTGSANFDFFFLQPGEWGRFAGLPVQAEAVARLRDMGVTAIRQGGSFAEQEYYFWKHWRGPAYSRPPAVWKHGLVSGWGPFEMMDLCEAAGIEAIITTYAAGIQDPEQMADLVEYCYGNISTTYGALRYSDGHPAPYRLHYIELGNEEYNVYWVDQVAAMERRASLLGVGRQIRYLFPQNAGPNDTDYQRAKQLHLGDHLVVDLHNKGAQGGLEKCIDLLHTFPDWGCVNLETNCGDHSMLRALDEAADVISWLNAGGALGSDAWRLLARGVSFCMERSGYNEGGLNDQGLIFFLPNMTWGQPPYYVHTMIRQALLPHGLNVSITSSSSKSGGDNDIMDEECGPAAAQVSDVEDSYSIYYVNPTDVPVQLELTFDVPINPAATALQLHHDDLSAANTPAQPDLIKTTVTSVQLDNGPLTVPAHTFIVLQVRSE